MAQSFASLIADRRGPPPLRLISKPGKNAPQRKMQPQDFLVIRRPRLAEVTDFPKISLSDYERLLKSLQNNLQLVQQAYLGTAERAVIVLEGWDTAGKGGVVRRLGWALDPRSLKVHPIAAPSSREQGQHYLQRFWEKLPRRGELVVFDRSWYGRVLVERVEGIATAREWKRAYREINEFERTLVADGIRVVKIFLHITPDEQIRRFKDRLTNPRKRWKLSYEDFRNRDRWSDYEVAIEEMMGRTSTRRARWYLVPANNKPYARLAAFNILFERLGEGVNLAPHPLDDKTAKAAARLFNSSDQSPRLLHSAYRGPARGD
jgi:AMP-polyphosphate phosphotransferase